MGVSWRAWLDYRELAPAASSSFGRCGPFQFPAGLWKNVLSAGRASGLDAVPIDFFKTLNLYCSLYCTKNVARILSKRWSSAALIATESSCALLRLSFVCCGAKTRGPTHIRFCLSPSLFLCSVEKIKRAKNKPHCRNSIDLVVCVERRHGARGIEDIWGCYSRRIRHWRGGGQRRRRNSLSESAVSFLFASGRDPSRFSYGT